jgi:hypothetical protein
LETNGLWILVNTDVEKKEIPVSLNNGLNHQLVQKCQLPVQNSVKTCNIWLRKSLVLLANVDAKLTATTANHVNQSLKLNLENTAQQPMFQFITLLVKSLLSLVTDLSKVVNTVVQLSGRSFENHVHLFQPQPKIAGLAKFWPSLKMFVDVNAPLAYQLNHQLVQTVSNLRL